MPRKISKTQAQIDQFKTDIENGKGIRDSMLAIGYSKSVANQGIAGLPAVLLAVLPARFKRLADLGKSVTPDQRVDLIRGKLIQNVIDGKDESVGSLKMLGNDKEVNLFVAENVTGIFLNRPPKEFEKFITLDAEVKD